MTRTLARVVLGAVLSLALSLVNVPQASADIKAVVDLLCDPLTDTVVNATSSGTLPDGIATPSAGSPCTAAIWTLLNHHFKREKIIAHDHTRAPASCVDSCFHSNGRFHVTFIED